MESANTSDLGTPSIVHNADGTTTTTLTDYGFTTVLCTALNDVGEKTLVSREITQPSGDSFCMTPNGNGGYNQTSIAKNGKLYTNVDMLIFTTLTITTIIIGDVQYETPKDIGQPNGYCFITTSIPERPDTYFSGIFDRGVSISDPVMEESGDGTIEALSTSEKNVIVRLYRDRDGILFKSKTSQLVDGEIIDVEIQIELGEFCGACSKPSPMEVCGRCYKVSYCDVECQHRHWSAHRCRKLL